MEVAYGALFAVGAVVIILSFVFGEFDSDHDGAMLLSPLAIAAGLTAGSVVGLVCEHIHLPYLSVLPAAVVGVVVYGVVLELKRMLKKQGSNAHFDMESYRYKVATVVNSPIKVGDWGMVTFTDNAGARETQKAHNTYSDVLPVGSKVVIHDVQNGELYVAPISGF